MALTPQGRQGIGISSWDNQLLSRVIRSGNIGPVLKWGITQDDFQTAEGRAVFQQILAYSQNAKTAGSILGENAFREKYPTYQLVDDESMSFEALCHELRQQRVILESNQLMMSVSELMQTDPQRAINMMAEGSRRATMLFGGKATDVLGDIAFEEIMSDYAMRQQGITTAICPWPWAPLQEATGGYEPEDYIVLYGRPKSMKTWVLCYMIAFCWMNGIKPLIYTKEMTANNILQRVYTILAGVDYARFRKAKLEPAELQRMQQVHAQVRMMKNERPFVVLSAKDAGENGDTVPWLRSKIEEHQPGMAFIDGMYLMSTTNTRSQKDNERVRDISRSLRQTILDTGVPMVCTLQANRDAAKNKDANLDEIAFSDAIGQDATMAMRVINEKNTPYLTLMIGGSREFSLPGLRIYGQPSINFGYAGPITTGELLDAQREDDASASQGAPPAMQPRTKKKATKKTKEDEAQKNQEIVSNVINFQKAKEEKK